MVAIAATNAYAVLALVDDTPPPALADTLARLRATLLPVGSGGGVDRNILGARIDRFVGDADRAVILLAHGAGCRAAAWWARLSPAHYVARVAGAVLIDPADADTRFASPATLLPFRSVTVDRSHPATIASLAREWGSELVTETPDENVRGGRLLKLVDRLTGAIVAHDVLTAEKLARLQRR